MIYKSYDGRAKELILLELKEEDTSYGGQEMMLEKSGMRILVKEELYESVVEIQRSDKMMTMCLIWGANDMGDICLRIPKWKARYTEG